jgi:hypothetical protein
MLILLSSALRPRYKDDILRCLAAPLGTRLRFRYEDRLIEPSLQDGKRIGEAIVCFLDEKGASISETFLIPVRSVVIEKINVHGTTRTLELCLGEFIYAENLKEFVVQVYKHKPDAKPIIDPSQKKETVGYWFFEKMESLPFQKGTSVQIWERIANQLADVEQFKSEMYFWAVLGVIEKNGNIQFSESFTSLPEKPLNVSKNYELLIYHFSPTNLRSDSNIKNIIQIKYGRFLESVSSTEIEIDSAYDLKQIIFKAVNTSLKTEKTYLHIGPKDKWHLELELSVSSSWLRPIIVFFIIAITLSLQFAPPLLTKSVLVQGICSVVLAFGTAGAAVFGIKQNVSD